MHPGACWERSVFSMVEVVVAWPLEERAETAVELGVTTALFYVF